MKLGTVAKVQGGYAFKSQEFQSEGVPIIRIGNLDGKNVEVDNDVCYPITFWDKHPEFRVEKNNILIAMSGATVGKIGLYESDEKALLNQRVCILKPDGKDVTNDYLYFFCLSPTFKNAIKENAFGCAQPNISAMQICDFEINVPDIKDQEKWVCQLRKIKNIIDKREQEIVELDNLIKSRFVEMFGDPSSNAKGYPEKLLPEIAEYWNGLTYKPEDVSDEGTIVLRSSNIQNAALDFVDTVRVVCNIGEKKYVQDNDILMCSRNGSARLVGKVALIKNIEEPMSFGAFMMIIRSIYYPYLMTYFQLPAFRAQITTGATTTINQITGRMLDVVKLPVPDLDTVNEFADFVKQVDKLKFEVQKSLDETQTLMDSLMQQYFG